MRRRPAELVGTAAGPHEAQHGPAQRGDQRDGDRAGVAQVAEVEGLHGTVAVTVPGPPAVGM